MENSIENTTYIQSSIKNFKQLLNDLQKYPEIDDYKYTLVKLATKPLYNLILLIKNIDSNFNSVNKLLNDKKDILHEIIDNHIEAIYSLIMNTEVHFPHRYGYDPDKLLKEINTMKEQRILLNDDLDGYYDFKMGCIEILPSLNDDDKNKIRLVHESFVVTTSVSNLILFNYLYCLEGFSKLPLSDFQFNTLMHLYRNAFGEIHNNTKRF